MSQNKDTHKVTDKVDSAKKSVITAATPSFVIKCWLQANALMRGIHPLEYTILNISGVWMPLIMASAF